MRRQFAVTRKPVSCAAPHFRRQRRKPVSCGNSREAYATIASRVKTKKRAARCKLAPFMELKRKALTWVMLLAGSVAMASADPGPAVSSRANIVLITLDTTRADRMGFLGSKLGLTPSLDALARQA